MYAKWVTFDMKIIAKTLLSTPLFSKIKTYFIIFTWIAVIAIIKKNYCLATSKIIAKSTKTTFRNFSRAILEINLKNNSDKKLKIPLYCYCFVVSSFVRKEKPSS